MKLNFSTEPKMREFGVQLVSKQNLPKTLAKQLADLKEIISREKFEGKETQTLFLVNGFSGFERFLIVGVSEKQATQEKTRNAAGIAVRYAQALKTKKICFLEPEIDGVIPQQATKAIIEGATLANYSFQKYKTKQEERKVQLEEIELVGNLGEREKKELLEDLLVCENANIIRDFINDNSELVTPVYLAEQAEKIAEKAGVKVKVFDEKEIKSLKMGCFLAVSQANTTPPRMVVLEWNGAPEQKEKILLVGKGICFDTGGLDLKPGESMATMRYDMAGAAVVLGVLKTAADLKIKKNIVGIMSITENLIGEKSYRQGDVLTSMKGLTVENNSTDAEGRLVLADCLYYGATKFNPSLIVSISTLTGSVKATFGSVVAGFCSTDEKAAEKISKAGDSTGELVWRMPLNDQYLAETKSTRADLRSTNKNKTNGMIYGAVFLTNFVEEKPYLHLDIAGTAFLEDTPKPYLETGATGYGVRLLTEMLKE